MARVEPLCHDDGPVFQESWQAQTLAIADTLIETGTLDPNGWAQALSAKLAVHQAKGDTVESYYAAALDALEELLVNGGAMKEAEQSAAKAAWIDAYETTPHGAPVELE